MRPATDSRYAEIRQKLGRVPDPTRLQGSELLEDLVSEQRQIEAQTSGHALKEHLVPETLLRRRAATGERARGGVDRHRIANATGFRSPEALVAAVVVAWDHPQTVWQRTEAERRYNSARDWGASRTSLERIAAEAYVVHIGPVERALGPDWRQHVEGYTKASHGHRPTDFGEHSAVKTTWKMTPKGIWRLDDCYPISQ